MSVLWRFQPPPALPRPCCFKLGWANSLQEKVFLVSLNSSVPSETLPCVVVSSERFICYKCASVPRINCKQARIQSTCLHLANDVCLVKMFGIWLKAKRDVLLIFATRQQKFWKERHLVSLQTNIWKRILYQLKWTKTGKSILQHTAYCGVF